MKALFLVPAVASVISALEISMAALATAPRVSAFTQARLPARLNRKSVVVRAAAADQNAVQASLHNAMIAPCWQMFF